LVGQDPQDSCFGRQGGRIGFRERKERGIDSLLQLLAID
jgi:hypothetical protein